MLAVLLAVAPPPIWAEAPAPALRDDLPRNFDDATAELTRRLNESFPAGSAEADLVSTLRAQGFTVWPEMEGAEYRHQRLICEDFFGVTWQADDSGNLTEISGSASATCL